LELAASLSAAHSRENGNPEFKWLSVVPWVSAFAGTSAREHRSFFRDPLFIAARSHYLIIVEGDRLPRTGRLQRISRERAMNSITLFITIVLAAIGGLLFAAQQPGVGILFIVLAILVAASLKMANVWQRFVILRAGNLQGVKGPGLFFIIPILDSIAAVIDQRIQTTAFAAEAALTKDTVPVNVDAIIFWHVHDAQKAALNITDYRQAIDRVAQTSLREMIGASMLSALLSERQAADELLRTEISRKTADWGISVNSVEIRDVAIPVALQDAMSRQAQAEREKQARVILGSAEAEVAAKFVEAANAYAGNPAALHLRAMNIIYETTKERGTTILIPTSMVDSMNVALPVALSAHRDMPPKAGKE
jgi:regulator of protease activity HflC (stomatin/prohibitin superfamily)